MTYYSELVAAHKARRARLWAGPPKPSPVAVPVPEPPAAVLLAQETPIKSKPRPCTMADLVRIVAEFYNVSPRDITGARRFGLIVKPRQVVMYFGRKLLRLSTPIIGREIGRRDHTTVHFAIQKIEQNLALSWDFYNELQKLECIILGEWDEYSTELDGRTDRYTGEVRGA